MTKHSRRNALLLSGLAVLVGPAAAIAQTQFSDRSGGIAPHLAQMRGLGGVSLHISQLALDRATDGDVVAFARLEVLEQEMLESILRESEAAGDLESNLPRLVTDQVARVSALQGNEFELAYLEAQITIHERLLEAGDVLADAGELSLETVTAKLAAITGSSHLLLLTLLQQKLGAQRIDRLEEQGLVE